MNYNIIDNFLPKTEFERLKNIVQKEINWFFQASINSAHTEKDDDCYFTHSLFNYGHFPIIASNWLPEFKIISDKLQINTLIRMKLNLYIKTNKIEVHKPHTDYNYSHKGCILSFNTCNGATIIYDENNTPIKIDSVENRALLFDPSIPHSSTSCTNAKARFNVNINYF